MPVFADLIPSGLSQAQFDAPNGEAEPVVVTPCRQDGGPLSTIVRDRVFASRCEFAWRSETVSYPSGDNKRPLVFKRHRQIVQFDRADLHDHFPRVGDQITRSWDGTSFRIVVAYTQRNTILCEVVQLATHVH